MVTVGVVVVIDRGPNIMISFGRFRIIDPKFKLLTLRGQSCMFEKIDFFLLRYFYFR